MNYRILLAATAFTTLTTAASADTVTLKFWDNQQTESGLSQYQKQAVRSFEKETRISRSR